MTGSTTSRRGFRSRAVLLAVIGAFALLGAGCVETGGGGSPGTPPGSTATVTIGSETVTVSVPTGLIVTVDSAPAASVPPTPSGLVFPLGALDINVSGATPGSVVPVSIVFENPVDTVRKVVDGAWDPFFHDGATGAMLSADGMTISLDLQDGGRGDSDGVANGTIVDPVAGATASSLLITSNDLPLVTFGQPYSHQLETAGASGPVTWSLLKGSLPTGIALDSAGLLSGTAVAGPGGGPVRVQVTDGSSTVTKLLVLFGTSANDGSAISAGTPLPDGTAISLGTVEGTLFGGCPGGVCFFTQPQSLASDGTLSPISTISINSLRELTPNSIVSPSGQMVASAGPPSPALGGFNGPVEILDGNSGATLVTLESSPTFEVGTMQFSPNGLFFAMYDVGAGSYRIYDTGTWTIQRTVSSTASNISWSPVADEFVVGGGPSVDVYSTTNPALDRSFAPGGQAGCYIHDWSATNRLAVGCGGFSIVTASAVDGSDVRTVAAFTCDQVVVSCSAFLNPRFSPSGGSLVFYEAVLAPPAPPAPQATTLSHMVVAPDVSSAPFTSVVGVPVTHFVVPIYWR